MQHFTPVVMQPVAVCIAALAIVLAPRCAHAQRVIAPFLQAPNRTTVAVWPVNTQAQPAPPSLRSVARNAGSVSVTQGGEPCRGNRRAVVHRGLLWGAVLGGIVGYAAGRKEEYGGAAVGLIAGAVIGAPLGMVIGLLATPCTAAP